MSTVEQQKKPKTLSPEQLERKKIKDQKKVHVDALKALVEREKAIAPAKKAKSKTVLTETMRLAQTVSKSLKETKKDKTGKTVPKLVPSRAEFRSVCAKVVGLNDLNADLTRGQVFSVVVQGNALLETMPKPAKKPRVSKSN